jgi:hypothetical protein
VLIAGSEKFNFLNLASDVARAAFSDDEKSEAIFPSVVASSVAIGRISVQLDVAELELPPQLTSASVQEITTVTVVKRFMVPPDLLRLKV